MKLLRYGPTGEEKPGLMDDDGNIRSLADHVADIDGNTISDESIAALRALNASELPLVESNPRLGPCVGKVGKFICIGLNYSDHAAESGMPVPSEPEVFSKATSAICGPDDAIIKPLNSEKLDWEVELAVVIGKHASYVSEEEAINHIAGYCVCNDVSERSFQLEKGSQWDKGKGCDTDMWLEVNGHRYQDGNTQTMIFDPAFIVSYLSQFMSLQPGDVISTGTPPGVGLGQKPPVYLNTGDRIELGIDRLGTQRQTVVKLER
jgi:2-keto-4-pentenoate hydratase/2-oxohepta-3-ene-1,7-dioic acid hydratase in catechol pathway